MVSRISGPIVMALTDVLIRRTLYLSAIAMDSPEILSGVAGGIGGGRREWREQGESQGDCHHLLCISYLSNLTRSANKLERRRRSGAGSREQKEREEKATDMGYLSITLFLEQEASAVIVDSFLFLAKNTGYKKYILCASLLASWLARPSVELVELLPWAV